MALMMFYDESFAARSELLYRRKAVAVGVRATTLCVAARFDLLFIALKISRGFDSTLERAL